jgi:hypothetical protein
MGCTPFGELGQGPDDLSNMTAPATFSLLAAAYAKEYGSTRAS